MSGLIGMSIDGVHSSDFPLLINRIKRPILSKVRQTYETIPGKDGSYDFSDGTLEDAIVGVECTLITKSITDLRTTIRQIAHWIYGTRSKTRIIFDDEPTVFYYGRIANQIDPEQIASIGEFELQFRCDPVAYAVDESVVETSITVAPFQISINSGGTSETPPVIELTNEGETTITSFMITKESLSN